ncbi:MAG: hypothetical protein V1789_10510 [PVC group bacterium]
MKKYLRFTGIVIAAIDLGLPCIPECRGAVGDIINQFPVVNYNWGGGGVAYRDGYVYTHGRTSNNIYKRHPVTGEILETIWINLKYGATMTWDSARQTWWMTDPFDYEHGSGDCYQFPATGGNFISSFEPGLFETGIFYDAGIDRLWIAGHIDGYFAPYTAGGVRDGDKIYPGFNPAGIARVENYFWVGNHTDGSYGCFIRKVNMDGSSTGVQFVLPWAGYDGYIQANDMAFDGRYLWVRGQNPRTESSMIYQVDIGFASPTPAPSPTPATLELPILDSGDYNGDSTSDIAVFRENTGLWAVRGVTRVTFGRRGDVPVSGDYNGDGTTDIGIRRANSRLWAIRGITRAYFGGTSGYTPVPGDYDGDGSCDIGLFKNSSALWVIRSLTRFYFGQNGDFPVPGYFADHRVKDAGIFRPSTGLWGIRNFTRVTFGRTGDTPIPADFDSDGLDDIAVFRPASKLWAVKGLTRFYFGSLLSSQPQPGDYRGDGTADAAVVLNSFGLWKVRGATRLYFGLPGDFPVSGRALWNSDRDQPILDSGDYDGDGTSEIACFRESSGLWAIRGATRVFYGKTGDIPVSGDYNGDGTTDIGIYRQSNQLWSVRNVTRFYLGESTGLTPVPGDYNGDGTCDFGIFNGNTGYWKLRIQLLVPFTSEFYYGTKGDKAVPGYYTGGPIKNVACYRPSTGRWSIQDVTRFYFGKAGDVPIPGDYDGDGVTDIGIYRQSERLWSVKNITRVYYGATSNCRPVPADYRGTGGAVIGVYQDNLGRWAIRGLTKTYFGSPGDLPVTAGSDAHGVK